MYVGIWSYKFIVCVFFLWVIIDVVVRKFYLGLLFSSSCCLYERIIILVVVLVEVVVYGNFFIYLSLIYVGVILCVKFFCLVVGF